MPYTKRKTKSYKRRPSTKRPKTARGFTVAFGKVTVYYMGYKIKGGDIDRTGDMSGVCTAKVTKNGKSYGTKRLSIFMPDGGSYSQWSVSLIDKYGKTQNFAYMSRTSNANKI